MLRLKGYGCTIVYVTISGWMGGGRKIIWTTGRGGWISNLSNACDVEKREQ